MRVDRLYASNGGVTQTRPEIAKKRELFALITPGISFDRAIKLKEKPGAPIHRFLGGGQKFFGVGEIFFSRHHAKNPVSAPPIKAIHVLKCTKS